MEEWLLLEDHTREHASKGPNIKRVVIGLEVDQKLWTFEISTGNSNIVFLLRMIEFSETPIDKSKPLIAMINHNVVRLDISVHNTL